MKFQIENIGVIRYAEIELGKMTVLCGLNNSGKTYITYAIYGFLYFWNNHFYIETEDDIIRKLKDSGVSSISTKKYVEDALQIIECACNEYSSQLASVFSAKRSKFENSVFNIIASSDEISLLSQECSGGIESTNAKTKLTYSKKLNGDEIVYTLFTENSKTREIPDIIISQFISYSIKKIIFGSIFPNVFIASAERTGAAIFRKELNFARNKLLDAISKNDEIDPILLLNEGKSDYAWPVDHNVDFVRNLANISKNESELFSRHKTIITSFFDILGGDYLVNEKDELFFVPASKTAKKNQLTMDESSSSVRSLLDIGFYLHHEAQIGDMLIIDEPELNLHPNNQRKIARLLASLINCGLNIFVTTHSDYILRELNNLILLNGDSPHLQGIISREGYSNMELIKVSDIKLYTTGESKVLLPGRQKKNNVQTLIQIPIDTEQGFKSSSFDEAINDMNRIADEIMFGG